MCYHPWVGLDISPQGEFKPCCKFSHSLGNTISDYETNPELAQLRQDFVDGKKNPGCSRCWRDEAANLPSKRTLDNTYTFKNPQQLDQLLVLSVSFGNTCNLACRTCNSYSSSKWSATSKAVEQYFPEVKIWGHNKFYRRPEFFDSILSKAGDLLHIDIPGGEPFYADRDLHYSFLTKLLDHNSGGTKLHYTTNATVLPEQRLLDIWQKFRNVDVQISIDGTEHQFEYNRWPAQWQLVLENIEFWKHQAAITPNMQLSISHTVSIFTVADLPKFIDWCRENSLPEPYLGLVSQPPHYSITVLPQAAKDELAIRFTNYPVLVPVIAAMMAKDDSNQLDNLAKYLKILDKQRNQSFAQTFPHTYQLLGDSCQTLYQQY